MTTATLPQADVPHRYRRFAQPVFRLKIRDRILQFVYAIPMGHIGVFAAVAIYFLATQKIPWITYHWNHLLPYAWWTPVRHDIRNGILEGELAAGAAIIAFANALRCPPATKLSKIMSWVMGYTATPDLIDKFMNLLHIPNMHQTRADGTVKKTTIWQYTLAIPSVILMGIPGNLLGFAYFYGIKPGILDLLHKAHVLLYGWSVTPAAGTGAAATEANLARAGFDAKIIGILGTLFFARRVFLKIGLDYQEWLARQQASHYVRNLKSGFGRARNRVSRPRWPLPATYRALAWHDIARCEETGEMTARRHIGRVLMLALIPGLGWLAWYGHGILAAHGGV